jgi:superfamily II DNA or RNA helicase
MKFLTQFHALEALERYCVCLLAVAYTPVSIFDVRRLLERSSATPFAEYPPSEGKLMSVFDSLFAQGIASKEGDLWLCARSVVEIVTYECVKEGTLLPIAEVIHQLFPRPGEGTAGHLRFSSREYARAARVFFYSKQIAKLDAVLSHHAAHRSHEVLQRYSLLQEIVTHGAHPEWLATLSPDDLVRALIEYFQYSLLSSEQVRAYLEYALGNDACLASVELKAKLIEVSILSGAFDHAVSLRSTLPVHSQGITRSLRILTHVLRGDCKAAVTEWNAWESQGKGLVGFSVSHSLSGPLLILSAFTGGESELIQRVIQTLRLTRKEWPFADFYRHALACATSSDYSQRTSQLIDDQSSDLSFLCTTQLLLVAKGIAFLRPYEKRLKAIADKARVNHLWVLEAWSLGLLFKCTQRAALEGRIKTLLTRFGGCDLATLFSLPKKEFIVATPTHSLSSQKVTPHEGGSQKRRLLWCVHKGIIPFEQRRLSLRRWSKPKEVPLLSLAVGRELSESDKRILDWLSSNTSKLNERDSLGRVIHPELAFELVDVSNLRVHSPTQPLKVTFSKPRIKIVCLSQSRYSLTLDPPPFVDSRYSYSLREPLGQRTAVMEVTRYDEGVAALADRISHGEEIIVEDTETLRRWCSELYPLASIEAPEDLLQGSLASVELHESPRLLLTRIEVGLALELRYRLFGDKTPLLVPGNGSSHYFFHHEGEGVLVKRDLQREQAQIASLLEKFPLLACLKNDSLSGQIDDPNECLSLLLSLHEASGELVIEGAEHADFKVRGEYDTASLRVAMTAKGHWFQTTAELQIDDTLKLSFRDLFGKVESSKNNFIRLDDGSFIKLTESFRSQVARLSAFYDHESDTLKVSHLAAGASTAVFGDASFTSGEDEWREATSRIESLGEVQVELSKEFQGSLRTYQQEGFEWLAQRTSRGIGVCLADDMGLGKTVQAIALLLSHASEGPSLVVCPATVESQWKREIGQFAPSLVVRSLWDAGRLATVRDAKASEVIVLGYGLLQRDEVSELLSSRQWSLVVLDEAQAIKNSSTKRAVGAFRLRAERRIALSGTPIENHLGEVWSLFNFLNPGLLPPRKRFARQLSLSHDQGSDDAVEMVKRLIKPFVLRRTKDEVLKELPSRTDLIIDVDPFPEEAALYESIRERASEGLTTVEDGNHASLFSHVLSALTRLRQAACHPRLIVEQSPLRSAKLERLLGLIEELRENNHRALVFSQFVSHLALVREALVAHSIPFQYLDGSSTRAERETSVQTFQEGTDPLFLISLKAGGTGLNLTAADFVIHLDPWWNPAVEDQASDRAHRLGQTKPVTVYRLITKNTIEEKILSLHVSKRNLAQDILSGTDTARAFSLDELRSLI